MTDRDRLIKLIQKEVKRPKADALADHLLANGVIVPVMCKDCAVPHNKWTGCPKLNGLIPPPDFYCSYGELKEREGK